MSSIARVPLKDWVLLNLEIGALSFGGAGRILLFQEAVVDKHGWMSDEEFQDIMTVSQVFPGANLLNLSIQLGLTLNGGWAALLGLLALGIPGALVALIIVKFINLDHEDIRGLFQGFSLASVLLFAVFIARMYKGIRLYEGRPVATPKFVWRLAIVAAVAASSAVGAPLVWTLIGGGVTGFLLERNS